MAFPNRATLKRESASTGSLRTWSSPRAGPEPEDGDPVPGWYAPIILSCGSSGFLKNPFPQQKHRYGFRPKIRRKRSKNRSEQGGSTRGNLQRGQAKGLITPH